MYGIAVIDYHNNGSPGACASLARALNYPWAMICDGDQGGNDHIDQLRSHNFTEAEITDLVTQLPAGIDLAQLIIGSALRPFMLAEARELDPTIVVDDQAILTFAAAHKEVRSEAHTQEI